MRRAFSLFLLIPFLLAPNLSFGKDKDKGKSVPGPKGRIVLDIDGSPPGQMKDVTVEVWRIDVEPRQIMHQGKAAKISAAGIKVPEGTYKLYIENGRTGLIVPYDNDGLGYQVTGGEKIDVPVQGFQNRVDEVKAKDRQERSALQEKMKNQKGRRGTLAVVDEGEGGGEEVPEFAPGELLIRYADPTTLADRFEFVEELDAENRSKVMALDVYRVKVDESSDLEEIIQTYADDPRLRYMEMNMAISIPEPPGEETRR